MGILLLPETDVATVEERLRQVERKLSELSHSGAVPFPMSLCHGTVDGSGASDAEAVLSAADERMYQEKKRRADMQGAAP